MTSLIVNASYQAVPTQSTESDKINKFIREKTIRESLEVTQRALHPNEMKLETCLNFIACCCPCFIKGMMTGIAEHNLLQAKAQSVTLENAQKAMETVRIAMQIEKIS